MNKPYNKFLKVWHAKLKLTSEYIRQTYSLRRIIDMEKVRHRIYSIEFYVDKDGIIRRYEQTSKPRPRSHLTKYQRRYNDNVKIPYLGVCKYDVSNLYRHSKTNPILLGEFYVALERNVVKVPVYTCCSQLMIDYHCSSNLAKFIEDRDLKFEEKKRRITETWIPITSSPYFGNPITANLEGQYVFKEIPNPGRANLINQLSIAISKGNTEEINKLRDIIANTPKTKTIDVGYGKFYLFIKRADYEKQLKILHKT